jgi:hypothetical protein
MKHTNLMQLEKITDFQNLCFLQGHRGGFSPHNAMRECNLSKEVIYASIELGLLIKSPKKGVYFVGKRIKPQAIQTRMKILKAKNRNTFNRFWRCVSWIVSFWGYEIKRKSIY